jgi:hypothetical protein
MNDGSCASVPKPAAEVANRRNPRLARRAAFSRVFEMPASAALSTRQLLSRKRPELWALRVYLLNIKLDRAD